MNKNDFKSNAYVVCGLPGFSLDEAARFWKARFETFQHFRRDVITHERLEDFSIFIAEIWDTISPITVGEALQERNLERRRTMFECIGVAKLFGELEPELLDRQTINKKRIRWDEHNNPYEHRFDDTYELYEIKGENLFGSTDQWNIANPVYAVRCHCTTTGREYWIYVPLEAAFGYGRIRTTESGKPDAIRAIAWTIRIDVSNPERIYRQGDIIVVVESEDSRTVEPYHLGKEQYLELMYSET